jgi:hypothetical protein
LDITVVLKNTPQSGKDAHLIRSICEDRRHFSALMDCFFSGDFHLSHRASLVIPALVEEKPIWMEEQVSRMVNTLEKGLPDWYKGTC